MFESTVIKSYNLHSRVSVLVLNATFNNISVIDDSRFYSWRKSEEKQRLVASDCQTLSDNAVSNTPRHERIRTYNFSGGM